MLTRAQTSKEVEESLGSYAVTSSSGSGCSLYSWPAEARDTHAAKATGQLETMCSLKWILKPNLI